MTTTVSEYIRIISDVAKHIYGEQCKEINYGQLTDIITRLYGDESEGGGMEIQGEVMYGILESILSNENVTIAHSIYYSHQLSEKFIWVYKIDIGDGFISVKK